MPLRPPRRAFALLLRASHLRLLAGSVLLCSNAAHAQTESEVERRTNARALFDKGDELQKQGNYAQAIEKYEAARKQFDAPTIVLRVAQCQANMGKLIEAAETYRTVIKWATTPQDPPQFRQSKVQAEAELPQVEAKIPRITLQIKPAASGLQIQFDGQSLDPAMIGVVRPLNPGPHRVVAFAPGYATGERSVILKERESITLTLELTPAPPTNAPLPPPAVYEDPQRKEPPPPALPPPTVPAAPQEPSRIALMLEAEVGALFPTGTLPDESVNGAKAGTGLDITDRASTGPSFGAGIGIRVSRVILQFQYQGAVLKTGNVLRSANTHYLGGTFGYLSRLDGAALVTDLNLGWRSLSYDGPAPGNSIDSQTYAYSGVNLGGGLGVSIPIANNTWRIVPKATVSLGVFRDSVSVVGSASFQAFWGLGVAVHYEPLPLSK